MGKTTPTSNSLNKETICFVAGKSGGHIIPCLTLASDEKKTKDINILFFSSNTSLDKRILADNSLIWLHVMLPLSTIHPSSFTNIFTIIWHIFSSFFISFCSLYKHKPSRIITTGGVVALPPCIAAFLLRIPIIVYSLDAIPGKAIKTLTPFATTIMVCFKNAQRFFPAQKCAVRPYPIRYNHATALNPQDTKKLIKFDELKKIIVVLGGSQGSLFLNHCIKEWVSSCYFSPETTQIIHQTGASDPIDWHAFYTQSSITAHVFSYHPDLAPFYTIADLIICRAGAGTLFEIEFFKKPCLIIPLRSKTTTHQVDNAHAMSQEYPHHFAWIDQKDIERDYSLFFCKINELLQK